MIAEPKFLTYGLYARSRDVIRNMTIRLAVGHFLLVVLWNQVSISSGFQDILYQTSYTHRHNAESSLRMRDVT